jgi:hypothetical protein
VPFFGTNVSLQNYTACHCREICMEIVTAAPAQTIVDVQHSGLSLRAIVGGAIAATAVTLLLTALGAGLGLSSVSPWSDAGVSATTFKVGSEAASGLDWNRRRDGGLLH